MYDEELLLCFIDLQKSFARDPMERVWQILIGYGVMNGLRNDIRSFCNDTNNLVRTINVQSSCLKTTKGVRQGGVLSPILFVIFMNKVIQKVDGHVKNQ